MRALLRWWITLNTLELSALQMRPIPKSWTTELVKYQQLSEIWIKIWKDHNINLDTKMKFYNVCVLCTLLYDAECWTLTETDDSRLDAFDMRCQRKILRVTWSQHNSNTISTRTTQPQLTSVVRKRRLQWFDHVQRMDMDRIPKKVYTWKPVHGKRRPGRPKM